MKRKTLNLKQQTLTLIGTVNGDGEGNRPMKVFVSDGMVRILYMNGGFPTHIDFINVPIKVTAESND